MMVLRFVAAACLAASGYIHAGLYVHGYRVIPVVGPSFLWLAAASMAVALLIAAGAPPLVQLLGAALAAGALGGFLMSRTVGILGFTEQGWQPAPEALISVLTEVGTVVVIGFLLLRTRLRITSQGLVTVSRDT